MRIIASVTLLIACLSARVLAVTPEELVRLRGAGLGDEVLLALVDATGVQGRVGADEALDLGRAGLSDRVIAAAIRRSAVDAAAEAQTVPSPEMPPGPISAIPPEPPIVVVTQQVPVFVPWVVVPARVRGAHEAPKPTLGDYKGFGRFINTDLRPLNTGFIDPPETRSTGAPSTRR